MTAKSAPQNLPNKPAWTFSNSKCAQYKATPSQTLVSGHATPARTKNLEPQFVIVSCPAGLALIRKHRLVTMLEFLRPGSAIQPKYWPIRIEELHNRFKTVKNHSRNKVKLRIGRSLDAISSFIVAISRGSVSFLVKRRVTIHKVRSEKQLDNKHLEQPR